MIAPYPPIDTAVAIVNKLSLTSQKQRAPEVLELLGVTTGDIVK